jgi:hypothetical protein
MNEAKIQKPSELLRKLLQETIEAGMRTVGNGNDLIPFLVTDGEKAGAITVLGCEDFDKSTQAAKKIIARLQDSLVAYAYAYDGYLTLEGERHDAIFVEAVERAQDHVFVFAQRYRPKGFFRPAKAIGNPDLLMTAESQLRKTHMPGDVHIPSAPP